MLSWNIGDTIISTVGVPRCHDSIMKYDIILITDFAGKYWHIRPLGAYRLATELRKHGYSVKVLDYANRWFEQPTLFFKLLNHLIGDNTLFVGFSSTFFGLHNNTDIKSTKDLRGSLVNEAMPYPYPCEGKKFDLWLKLFKQTWPNVKIVYGGAKADSHKTSLTSLIDYVVLGLADSVIVDLANHLKNNTHIKFNPVKVNGIKILDYDTKGTNFDFASSITEFRSEDHIQLRESLPLETSRGCMFKCKFCSYPLLGRTKTDPDYHRRVECLAHELKYNFINYGVDTYSMVDDTFNETTQKIINVGQAAEQANVKLNFQAYVRIDLLHRFPEQIQLLKDIGLRSVFFGIESFNDASASAIGKGLSHTKVKETLQHCRAVWGDQVFIHANFIAGLPHETRDTLNTTMSWLMDATSIIDSFSMTPLAIDDHGSWSSEFFKERQKHGYKLNADGTWANEHWSQHEVIDICDQFNSMAFDQGIIKVANINLFGLHNLGYKLDDLKGVALKDLPWKELEEKTTQKFVDYMIQVFSYEQLEI